MDMEKDLALEDGGDGKIVLQRNFLTNHSANNCSLEPFQGSSEIFGLLLLQMLNTFGVSLRSEKTYEQNPAGV